MISRSLFAAVWLACPALAAPPLTTIQDVLYKADGTRFNGTLTISWTSFDAVDSSAIITQTISVTVVGGNLRVQLVPTTTAVPPANYTVKYNSDGRIQFSETWAVPSSVQPLRIRDVRMASTQAGLASAVTVSPPVQESDIVGLVADLGARPLKGPGFAAGRVALVDPTGSLESVTGSPSDCVRVDGSSGPCGGAQPSFVDGDSPAGIVDGSNTSFALSAVPNPPSSLAVYLNGILQKVAQDFTANGNAIQFVAAAAPQPGDTLLASYRLTDTVTAPPNLVSPQQINPAGLTAGQAWLWNGSSYVPGDVGNGGVSSTGSYSNPAWITSLAYAKITGVPSFEPAIQAGTAGQYWRWDKSWQTLNASAVANAADTTSSYSDPAWLTITKAKVGLGSVENTGLSTWAGTSNLTTIGTLAAGTVPWARLSGVPSTFAPALHSGTHQAAGSDPLTPAAIGAVANSARNQPNGYVGLDASGNAAIGTTLIDPVNGVSAPNLSSQSGTMNFNVLNGGAPATVMTLKGDGTVTIPGLAGTGSAMASVSATGVVTRSAGGSVSTVTGNAQIAVANGTTTPALSISPNSVGNAQLAAVQTRRTVCLTFGANNAGSPLADADLGPQSRQYFIPAAWTLVEMEVAGDAGTPQIVVGRSRAGAVVNVTSAALATAAAGGVACSNAGGTLGIDGATTCSATLQNTGFNAGDWVTLVSGVAGGVAKEMTGCLTFTVN